MGFIRNILARTSVDSDRSGFAMSPRSPSFQDLSGQRDWDHSQCNPYNKGSMGAGEDLAEYEAAKREAAQRDAPVEVAKPELPAYGSPMSASKRDVWRSTFNPGRNYSDKMRGGGYFDSVDGERGSQPSIWDHVLQSERRCSFESLDKDRDGFLSADDLRRALGGSEDVRQLIAAADRNGDGRIDRNEFQQLLDGSRTGPR